MKFRKLKASEIECRVATVKQTGLRPIALQRCEV